MTGGLFENLDGTQYYGAIFSDCRRYRYQLWRRWDLSKPDVMYIGLNPSKAGINTSDNTVTRCMNFAKKWGYGGMYMMNLFSFMATDPEDMIRQADPVGPKCDAHLVEVSKNVGIIVCAWGNHGVYKERNQQVLQLLPPLKLHYLRMTKQRQPQHPLYLPDDLKPIKYEI